MKLSILIPVYNEEKTIDEVLKRVDSENIPGVEKEIIVINDGSTDSTSEKLKKIRAGIKVINQPKNMGKGAAVVAGIHAASGEYVIIQDADLEYEPRFIKDLTNKIISGEATVVYGTRLKRMPNLKGEEKTIQFLLHYFGNRFLSLCISIVYGQWITDMETGYKLFPRNALSKVKINAKGFELEPEITAKLLKYGYKITEVPIKVIPRGYEEGKKINTFRDGTKAIWYIIKYRFVD